VSTQPVTLDMSTAQPIQAAPVKLDMSTAEPIGSAASRFGTNLLSGLGVTSDEQAKNFFRHPLDTVIKSFEAQGELVKKAREAYNRGDYMEALQHGLNYLVPFIGQQTDQAGTQLKEGDIAGGIGRTLGAAAPIVAGSPEVQSAASDAASATASTAARGVRAAARGANTVLERAPGSVGAATGSAIGHATGIPGAAEIGGAAGYALGKEVLPQVRIPGEGFGLPSRVVGGPKTIPPQAATPGEVETPAVTVEPAAVQPATVQPVRETAAAPNVNIENVPRRSTISGESALSEVLGRLPNNMQLKIARSRGIDVSKEALLKPTPAVTERIIKKIVDDYSDDELDGVRSTYMENEGRFAQHSFVGDVGKEANQTLNLQTYFPELKIPLAQTLRTQKAIQAANATKYAPLRDLSGALKTEASKSASSVAKPAASAAPEEDLTNVWQDSLDYVRRQRAKRTQ
jgi:hypothetical protein